MATRKPSLLLAKDISVPVRQPFTLNFSDGTTEDTVGVDAIIFATTAKRATAAEIVEWGRRLRAALQWSVYDYEAVPTETRPPPVEDDMDAGEVPHTGGSGSLGGLVIEEKHWYDEIGYGDYTFEHGVGRDPVPPTGMWGYEVCTLNRSAWFHDSNRGGENQRLWCASRGDAIDIVKAATALALLMDPHLSESDGPLGYEVRKDWRIWLGNDSSNHMFEFDHATRVELFEAYLRSGLDNDVYWHGQNYDANRTPCPVCGTRWRYSGDRDGDGKCPACAHGFKTGKKVDTRPDDVLAKFPSKEQFALMTTLERETLIRSLGEALKEAGVGDHVDVNGLLAYTERSKGSSGG